MIIKLKKRPKRTMKDKTFKKRLRKLFKVKFSRLV